MHWMCVSLTSHIETKINFKKQKCHTPSQDSQNNINPTHHMCVINKHFYHQRNAVKYYVQHNAIVYKVVYTLKYYAIIKQSNVKTPILYNTNSVPFIR